MTRIRHPSSRAPRLTFVAALIVAIGVAIASIFWSQAQSEKKMNEKMRPHETPVPSDAELRRQLTAEQYHVTRENGTETAFRNSTGTITTPAFMSTSSRASRSSLRSINSTAAPAGPVSPNRSRPSMSCSEPTKVLAWCAQKCAPKKAIRISVIFSMMVRLRLNCAIA